MWSFVVIISLLLCAMAYVHVAYVHVAHVHVFLVLNNLGGNYETCKKINCESSFKKQ